MDNTLSSNKSTRLYVILAIAVVVTLLRIYCGIQWAGQLGWKAPAAGAGGFGCTATRFAVPAGKEQELGKGLGGLCDWTQREADQPVIGLYGDFVKNIVIPNFDLFAWVTIITESFISISLIFGFLTRLGGALGTLWGLSLVIGLSNVTINTNGDKEGFTGFLIFIIPALLVAIIAPRFQYGLDNLLAPFYGKLASKPGWVGMAVRLITGVRPNETRLGSILP